MPNPIVLERRQALADLLSLGRQMSNVCFNIAQAGERIGGVSTIREDVPQTCDELRRKWDAAARRWEQLKKPTDPSMRSATKNKGGRPKGSGVLVIPKT